MQSLQVVNMASKGCDLAFCMVSSEREGASRYWDVSLRVWKSEDYFVAKYVETDGSLESIVDYPFPLEIQEGGRLLEWSALTLIDLRAAIINRFAQQAPLSYLSGSERVKLIQATFDYAHDAERKG